VKCRHCGNPLHLPFLDLGSAPGGWAQVLARLPAAALGQRPGRATGPPRR